MSVETCTSPRASDGAERKAQAVLGERPAQSGPEIAAVGRPLTLVRVLLDTSAVVVAVGLALFLRFEMGLLAVSESSPLTVRAHALACALWAGLLLATMALNRLHDEDTLFAGGGELARVVRSVVESAAVFSVVVFLTQSFYVSRSWFALTAVLSTAAVAAERLALRAFLSKERARGRCRRPMVLASKHRNGRLPDGLDEFVIVDHIDSAGLAGNLADEDQEGPTARTSPKERTALLLNVPDYDENELWKIVVHAGEKGYPVFIRAAVRSVGRDRLTTRELGGELVVKIAPPPLTGLRGMQKRMLDVAVASVLLLSSLPLLLAIAVSIVVTTGRPVLYTQERVGLHGRRFRMLKFRTMLPEAEAETGPVWATSNDPRCTVVGRMLRRSSLDELPQLWNVLKGDMSMVGPRPERPTFVSEFSDQLEWYAQRHRIRPGMTGWSQAHGLRGGSPLDARVTFDNWYIEHWSVPLDIKILLCTLTEVFRGRNAA